MLPTRSHDVAPDEERTARSAKLRQFYATYVAERAGCNDPRIVRAFATVPREPFAGPPPWHIAGPLTFYPALRARYVESPDDDPAFLYQDVLLALDRHRGINMGEPGFHAFCLAALGVAEGERVLHVGAGSGYYSALLAELTGPRGRVDAFEIDPALADRARSNLSAWAHVTLHARSGSVGEFPQADVIYVTAGCTHPSGSWLGGLAPGGRLMLPLQPAHGLGGMLLINRPRHLTERWPARFVTRSMFVGCEGLRERDAERRLAESFANRDCMRVRSLRFDKVDVADCWLTGDGWWLSTGLPDCLLQP